MDADDETIASPEAEAALEEAGELALVADLLIELFSGAEEGRLSSLLQALRAAAPARAAQARRAILAQLEGELASVRANP